MINVGSFFISFIYFVFSYFSPLMMITQKVTTLAFQVHDGEKSLMQFFVNFLLQII